MPRFRIQLRQNELREQFLPLGQFYLSLLPTHLLLQTLEALVADINLLQGDLLVLLSFF